jgi:hypothetical protein
VCDRSDGRRGCVRSLSRCCGIALLAQLLVGLQKRSGQHQNLSPTRAEPRSPRPSSPATHMPPASRGSLLGAPLGTRKDLERARARTSGSARAPAVGRDPHPVDGGPHVVISVARAPRLAAHQQTIGGASRAEGPSAIQPAAARAGGRKEEDVVPAPPSSPHRQDNNQNNTNNGNANGAARSIFPTDPFDSATRRLLPSPIAAARPCPRASAPSASSRRSKRTAARRASERARSAPVPGPGGRAPRVEVMRSATRFCRLQVTRVSFPCMRRLGFGNVGVSILCRWTRDFGAELGASVRHFMM